MYKYNIRYLIMDENVAHSDQSSNDDNVSIDDVSNSDDNNDDAVDVSELWSSLQTYKKRGEPLVVLLYGEGMNEIADEIAQSHDVLIIKDLKSMHSIIHTTIGVARANNKDVILTAAVSKFAGDAENYDCISAKVTF